jgi:hypothetical protein
MRAQFDLRGTPDKQVARWRGLAPPDLATVPHMEWPARDRGDGFPQAAGYFLQSVGIPV